MGKTTKPSSRRPRSDPRLKESTPEIDPRPTMKVAALALVTLALTLATVVAAAADLSIYEPCAPGDDGTYALPDLPYPYDSLEPSIDLLLEQRWRVPEPQDVLRDHGPRRFPYQPGRPARRQDRRGLWQLPEHDRGAHGCGQVRLRIGMDLPGSRSRHRGPLHPRPAKPELPLLAEPRPPPRR